MSLLVAEDINHSFGGMQALRGISLSFREGETVGIIGPNGAGKSTFFNVLSGQLAPTTGRVKLQGEVVSGVGAHRLAAKGLVKSYQITNLFFGSTCLQNVLLAIQAREFRYNFLSKWVPSDEERESALTLLDRVGLRTKAARFAVELSHGEQRCLELAVALAANPRILLLDEPTAGMSPEETIDMVALIKDLASERTIGIVEHKMKLVFGVCDRVVVLHHGTVLADGSPEQIQRNVEVVRVYLGGS